MDGSGGYHGKRYKSDIKRTMWFHSYVGYKTENNRWENKKNKWAKLIAIDNSVMVTRGKWGSEVVKNEGGQIYGDGRRLDSGDGHRIQYTGDES